MAPHSAGTRSSGERSERRAENGNPDMYERLHSLHTGSSVFEAGERKSVNKELLFLEAPGSV